jgi:hypothetical protein
MPSDNSQNASGIDMRPWTGPAPSMTSNMTRTPAMMINGPPMSPNIAKPRGTNSDLYMSQPRIRPFPTPTTKPGPRRNDHS